MEQDGTNLRLYVPKNTKQGHVNNSKVTLAKEFQLKPYYL